jgi:hypothetical protein
MAYTVPMKWYGLGLKAIMQGTIDFEDDTIKVALTTSSYTPDQDAHDFFNDVTNEVSATGYTAGGATLGSKTLGYTSGTNVLKIDGADVTWTITGSMTARNVIIYKATGDASTSPLIGYGAFLRDGSPSDVTANDGDFTITWSTDGILKQTAGT